MITLKVQHSHKFTRISPSGHNVSVIWVFSRGDNVFWQAIGPFLFLGIFFLQPTPSQEC